MTQQVGIAVVLRAGKVLVGRRAEDIPLPGMSEFPGGKCLPGETTQACAIRECKEETGLHVHAIQLLDTIEHQYPHGFLELYFWECEVGTATSDVELIAPWHWVPVRELSHLDFPPANQRIITQLIK